MLTPKEHLILATKYVKRAKDVQSDGQSGLVDLYRDGFATAALVGLCQVDAVELAKVDECVADVAANHVFALPHQN